MNNLLTRTISSAVFLAVMLAGMMFFRPFCLGILFLPVMTVGLYEFYAMLLPNKSFIFKLTGYATAIMLYAIFYLKNLSALPDSWFFILVLPVSILFIAGLYSKSEKTFEMIFCILAGIIYVALPFSLITGLAFVREEGYDFRILLALFIMLWSNDAGAYCFGSVFGRKSRHKLFERISPNKSWEGFFGGVITSLAATVILFSIYGKEYGFSAVHWFAIALIVAVFATFGDLFESMLKRNAGVKDSGRIMPGHGGVLDRFDGALIAFPCAMAYIKIINIF